ncbi:MAG: hypothetical protein AB8B56_13850 [Crocinitomicaceae bacterium]
MNELKKYWIAIPVMVLFAICIFTNPIYCALLMGSILLIFSLQGILFILKVQRVGIKRQGELKGFKTDSDGDKIPIIEFETQDGERISGKPYVTGSGYVSGIRLQEHPHTYVTISHLPNSPEKFMIISKVGPNYFNLALFALIGITLITLTILQLSGFINLF